MASRNWPSAASIGSYTVRAQAGSAGVSSTKSVGTSTYPWGLLLIALLVIQLVLLAVRNRARRKLAIQSRHLELARIALTRAKTNTEKSPLPTGRGPCLSLFVREPLCGVEGADLRPTPGGARTTPHNDHRTINGLMWSTT